MVTSILILGSSSFLAKPLIDKLLNEKKYKIVCLSRKNNKKDSLEDNSRLINTFINYADKSLNFDYFNKFDYIVNFVNAGRLRNDELLNFRLFISKVLTISKASLIHLSSANVVGFTKEKIVNEEAKCNPKNSYILKLNDEVALKNIAKECLSSIYILRPTEIIGSNSLNARKLVKSRINDTWIKKYIEKTLYGLRPMHYVSSRYLIDSIFKIIQGRVNQGTYIISQDLDKHNNYLDIIQIIDKIISTKQNNFFSKFPALKLKNFFKLIYRILKPNNFDPYIKFISLSPIIEPSNYKYFRKDLEEHVKSILKN